MAGKSGEDKYANFAIVSVVQAAINTLAFKKLETGISLTEKVAWVLNRIEYWLNPQTVAQFGGDGDILLYGLSLSSAWATAQISEITIIDFNALLYSLAGAATSHNWVNKPVIKSFADMPGGGILIPPNPLYLFCSSSGLGAVADVTARIHYTLKTLAVDEYWELVEARRVLSS